MKSPTAHDQQAAPVRPQGRSRQARRLRRRQFLLGSALLFTITVLASYHSLTRPARLIRFAERFLSTFTCGRVRIENASFSIFEGIRLQGAAILRGPSWAEGLAQNLPESPVLEFESLALRHDVLALLTGRLEVAEIVARGARLTLISDPASGRTNLSDLFRHQGRREKPDPARLSSARWPRVDMPNAEFSFHRVVNGQIAYMKEARIDLWATQRRSAAPFYQIIWRDRTGANDNGRAKLDVTNGTLEFEPDSQPPWLPLEFAIAALRITNQDIQRWINLLGIEGDFRVEDLAIGSTAGQLGARVRIVLRNAGLSVPLHSEEETLPRQERILCLDHVQGVLDVTAVQIRAEFQGSLRGRQCRTTLVVNAIPKDVRRISEAGWDLRIECDDFTLLRTDPELHPAEARAISLWPVIKRFYDDFQPQGRVKLTCQVSKQAGNEARPELVGARFEAVGCAGRYYAFPYPLQDISGMVEFNSRGGFEFKNLIGRHGNTHVTINGYSKGYSGAAEVNYEIVARNTLLDQDLYWALPGEYRESWDLFQLSGAADVITRITRPEGPPGTYSKISVTVEGELLDGRACYRVFPYAIEKLTGRFIIGDGLRLENIRGEQGTATVEIKGSTGRGPGGQVQTDWEISARQVPLDEKLIAAMPGRVALALEQLHLKGQADFSGRVFRTAEMEAASFKFEADLLDSALSYEEMPYELEECSAQVTIEPDRVRVRQFKGLHGPATVEGGADVDFGQEQTRFALDIAGRDVELDDALFKALPEVFGQTCRRLHPTGSVDLRVDYRRAESAPPVFKTIVTAKGNQVRYDVLPLPLSDVTGAMVITDREVEFIDIRARHEDAVVQLGGHMAYDADRTAADLRLSATNMGCSAALRDALPSALKNLWAETNPAGRFDMQIESLLLERGSGSEPTRWSAAGQLSAAPMSFDVGLHMRDARGPVTFQCSSGGAGAGIICEGQLSLESTRLENAKVAALTGRFVYDQIAGLLALGNLRAGLHGGWATGGATIQFGDGRPIYDAVCTLRGMQLQSVLASLQASSDAPPAELRGLLDATLALAGRLGDERDHSGWGRLHIRDAQIYKLPLVFAILNVAQLDVPEHGAFQECQFDFALSGEEMRLKDIHLDGPAVALVGSGSISTRTQELELDLLMSTPREALKIPGLTPLLEGAARELVEMRVSGPLANPEITTRPLRGFQRLTRLLLGPGGRPR